MDDMNALRDLGRELEHEPPASLARQRNRLLTVQKKRWFAKPKGWALIGAASVVTAAAVIVPFAIANQPITTADLLKLPGERTPPNTDAMNILILGSDSREGANAKYGKPGSHARSDTTLLVHLPKGRKNITVVSFPRDAMVQIPKCKSTPAQLGLLNSAYSYGGAACTWKMIEQLTDLHIDHSIEVDFTGLKGMVNALGGVPITLPKAVNDPKAKLNLAKGEHVVSGEQALGYVRSRHGFGDGSDLGRIKRQQQFMTSMVKKASHLLDNPVKLTKFLVAASKGLKFDKGLSMSELISIAASLDDQSKTTFVTVPWQPYSQDPSRIEFKQPAANRLFKGLISELVC
jgi:LCP family protein required for cell wall assembly